MTEYPCCTDTLGMPVPCQHPPERHVHRWVNEFGPDGAATDVTGQHCALCSATPEPSAEANAALPDWRDATPEQWDAARDALTDAAHFDAMLIERYPLQRDNYVAYIVAKAASEPSAEAGYTEGYVDGIRAALAEPSAEADAALLNELDSAWTDVERAIWPDGPAHGHGSGAYAALKTRIIRALSRPATPPPVSAEADAALLYNAVVQPDTIWFDDLTPEMQEGWRRGVAALSRPATEPSAEADATLRSITTRGQRPAGRGEWIAHEVDEVHSPGDPCRFCAALSRPATPPLNLPPQQVVCSNCGSIEDTFGRYATPPLDVERLAIALMNAVGNGWLRLTPPDPVAEWRENAATVAREYAALANTDPETAS